MIDVEPRELSVCRRHGTRSAALVRSQATSVSPVRTLVTCRGAPHCGMAAGTGQRRGAAGGVCRCLPHGSNQRTACSRAPHHDRPLPVTCGLTRRGCQHEMVPVCDEISHWTRFEHRGRNRRDGQHRVTTGVTDQLRVSSGGRDIGIDPLTTQLVINRRRTHRANTLGLGLRRRQRRGVYSLWSGYEIVYTDCGWCQRRVIRRIHPTNVNNVSAPSGVLTTSLYISL